jgi:hypothetical protein
VPSYHLEHQLARGANLERHRPERLERAPDSGIERQLAARDEPIDTARRKHPGRSGNQPAAVRSTHRGIFSERATGAVKPGRLEPRG